MKIMKLNDVHVRFILKDEIKNVCLNVIYIDLVFINKCSIILLSYCCRNS